MEKLFALGTPTNLLIAAILVMSFLAFKKADLMQKWMFDIYQIKVQHEYYRIFTSVFIHLDIMHLVFNLYALNSFARYIDRYRGENHATAIFLVSAIVANFFVLYWYRRRRHYRALGASGGVSGVIFAGIYLLPPSNFYLFFIPFPIPDRWFGIAYLVVSSYLMAKGEGRIGHSAHLAGAMSGLLIGLLLNPQRAMNEPSLLLWFVLPIAIVFITRWYLRFKEDNS